MDRNARLKEVVRAAKEHPVYREKFKGVHPEEVTLENLGELPLTTREEWVAYLKENPRPPTGASLMHLTPSPLMGWMPEYLSQEDLRYQTEALAEHYRRLGLTGKKVLVAFSYHVFAGGWLFHQALWRAGNLVFPHGPGEASRIAEIGQTYGFDVLVTNPSFALKVGQAGGAVCPPPGRGRALHLRPRLPGKGGSPFGMHRPGRLRYQRARDRGRGKA